MSEKRQNFSNNTACIIMYHMPYATEAAWIEFLCPIMMGCTFALNVGCCGIKQSRNAEL